MNSDCPAALFIATHHIQFHAEEGESHVGEMDAVVVVNAPTDAGRGRPASAATTAFDGLHPSRPDGRSASSCGERSISREGAVLGRTVRGLRLWHRPHH